MYIHTALHTHRARDLTCTRPVHLPTSTTARQCLLEQDHRYLFDSCDSELALPVYTWFIFLFISPQSARTYLEKHLDNFSDCEQLYSAIILTWPLTSDILYFSPFHAGTLDELVRHALQALRECLPNEQELTAKVRWESLTITERSDRWKFFFFCRMCQSVLWVRERTSR